MLFSSSLFRLLTLNNFVMSIFGVSACYRMYAILPCIRAVYVSRYIKMLTWKCAEEFVLKTPTMNPVFSFGFSERFYPLSTLSLTSENSPPLELGWLPVQCQAMFTLRCFASSVSGYLTDPNNQDKLNLTLEVHRILIPLEANTDLNTKTSSWTNILISWRFSCSVFAIN